MTPEQYAERKAARIKAIEEAHAEQLAKDLERLDQLEEEHGYERVVRVNLNGWQPGHGAATFVVARLPMTSEIVYKKFQQQIQIPVKSAQDAKRADQASDQLGEACMVYPDRKTEPELYKATTELAAGIIGHLAAEVVRAVQGKAAEEGK